MNKEAEEPIEDADVKPLPPVDTKREYDPVLPGAKDWPVVRMSRHRKEFIEKVIDYTFDRVKELVGKSAESMVEELETTLHREMLRIKQNPWKVDPEDDYDFWKRVRNELTTMRYAPNMREQADRMMREIISRYVNEIAGNFNPSSYRVARKVVTFGLTRLLNAARLPGYTSIFKSEFSLQDKVNIVGEVDQLRSLAKKGTIVMVPTHFSNLDSVLVGWVMNVLGLPPFIYGAGLNLFNINIFAYFMNSLGAYKVDRRKKNTPYLEALKAYSSIALEYGCHSLFFPGGTRSRSGKIEKRLKMGLLGTAMEAQRMIYEKDESDQAKKIFIVPVVLNYHFVLEAPSLINEYLKMKGQERYYVENDEFSNSYKITTFLLKFFTKGSDISVSIGEAMDLFGNKIDQEGNSIDAHGRKINTREYFMKDGEIKTDKQRDMEYTRMLSEVIVREYHKHNRVFSSHLVAFTAFQMIKKRHRKLDLYNLLRLPEEDLVIDYQEFKTTFKGLRKVLYQLYQDGKVKLAPHMSWKSEEVIAHGLENVGMYHALRPLVRNEAGDIVIQDMNKLYYYHNRMLGYELERYL
ncbi:MAG: 1-acyl-sn-glycerol-3-phosphate acyltransferase [Cyclobacteriaceae bacterium]|nr:1-acyl-sn-glycerol-3-phosphate acyltransferase [Cyclobacteriaceae bacterium]MCH8515072.1 1-acyl-sn-glycerol-3-phosphate acyltransferase [Cyclobacteriaceae bacterium]